MSTVAEYYYVLQIESDQLIVHNTKKMSALNIMLETNKEKLLPIAGNNFLISRSVPLGRKNIIVCDGFEI